MARRFQSGRELVQPPKASVSDDESFVKGLGVLRDLFLEVILRHKFLEVCL